MTIFPSSTFFFLTHDFVLLAIYWSVRKNSITSSVIFSLKETPHVLLRLCNIYPILGSYLIFPMNWNNVLKSFYSWHFTRKLQCSPLGFFFGGGGGGGFGFLLRFLSPKLEMGLAHISNLGIKTFNTATRNKLIKER